MLSMYAFIDLYTLERYMKTKLLVILVLLLALAASAFIVSAYAGNGSAGSNPLYSGFYLLLRGVIQ